MNKPQSPELSNLFAQLSQQAKKVEDAFADLATKTDAAAAKRDDQVQAGWRTMQADIDKQIKDLQAAKAARDHDRDVQRAEQNAQDAQARADWTAAYAVTASEMAWLASLDAQAARGAADALK